MKFEFSAGGIVCKKEDKSIFILLAQHKNQKGWIFPKGKIGDTNTKETKEEAALREVKEETGAEAEIIHALSPVTYWYVWEGEKIKKTVYYFIMEYKGGDISKHDFEMDKVEWFAEEEVYNQLAYPGDKKLWQEAMKVIRS